MFVVRICLSSNTAFHTYLLTQSKAVVATRLKYRFIYHYAVIMNYQRYFLTKITLLISKWKPGPGSFSEEYCDKQVRNDLS